MAATIYTDGVSATAQSATVQFPLAGGMYGITVSVFTTSFSFQRQGPDGTFVAATPTISAVGYTTQYVPPGFYQVVVGGSSAYAITRIKLE